MYRIKYNIRQNNGSGEKKNSRFLKFSTFLTFCDFVILFKSPGRKRTRLDSKRTANGQYRTANGQKLIIRLYVKINSEKGADKSGQTKNPDFPQKQLELYKSRKIETDKGGQQTDKTTKTRPNNFKYLQELRTDFISDWQIGFSGRTRHNPIKGCASVRHPDPCRGRN